MRAIARRWRWAVACVKYCLELAQVNTTHPGSNCNNCPKNSLALLLTLNEAIGRSALQRVIL